jgi:hypothetical protein
MSLNSVDSFLLGDSDQLGISAHLKQVCKYVYEANVSVVVYVCMSLPLIPIRLIDIPN